MNTARNQDCAEEKDPSKKVVVIGAGALGLGFLGPEFSTEAEVWFLDIPAKRDLIERIEQERSYTIGIAGMSLESRTIANVRAAVIESPETTARVVADADLCCTAVGAKNLHHLKPLLLHAGALRTKPTPLPILCAENGENIAAGLLSSLPDEPNLVAADTTMGRMCIFEPEAPPDRPALFPDMSACVVAEAFYGIPYEAHAAIPELPFSTLQACDTPRFALEEHIKLFAHNCGHALFAYAAARKGWTHIRDMAGDPSAMNRYDRMMYGELLPALESHDRAVFDKAEYMNYTVSLLRRIHSRSLNDTVERGIRGALEKLGEHERWVTAIRFMRSAGIHPKAYIETLADVIRIAGLTEQSHAVLEKHCHFRPEEIRDIQPDLNRALQ